VDGSFIQADASTASRIPREQLAEAAQVKRTVREYLAELEQENATEETVPQQERVSTTDPDATYATKGGPAALGYYDNYLIDNQSCVIVDVQATAARLSQESAAARKMITRFTERRGRAPQTLAADNTYGNGELLHWLQERGIAPHIRVKESPVPRTDLYAIEKFTYCAETNRYTCPAGKELTYVGSTRATGRMCISRRANVAATARKRLCAPAAAIGKSPSTCTNRRGNSHANWQKRRRLPYRSALAEKSKPSSRS
jgi:hypothetical protein